ncbi:Uncharacterised protein [Neisseria meningitidis]|nr:Uncharacterised protein [Neisseria meningitidis]CEZ52457.1 Uncharacterised protein [Neisseria meningitidis]CFA11531.1 Uncharacterised protein [Neisseria meningitidis]CFA97741.1 Uncharacterised protein [Neisseria meningitidis]CFB01456.1 Uncharacterised protein [Neisseria meningitidis]
MREAFGYPKLALVLRGQGCARPFAESRRTFAHIDGHVEHFADNYAYEFALCVFGLVVQAAQYAFAGFGVVFLHEGAVADLGLEPFVAEGFHKKAARVAEDLGLKQFYVRNGGINDVHLFIFHLKAV